MLNQRCMNYLYNAVAMTNETFYTECFVNEEVMGDVYVMFSKNPTAESKFLFTYDLLKKFNKLPSSSWNSLPSKEVKSDKRARKLRTEGNAQFQNKIYDKAYWKYNQSVMTADLGSQEYALALANRSAALYYLEEYDACITNIHYALAANYPKELVYKLYDREIKCLVKMRKISLAKLKFEELSSYLTQVHLSKEKKKCIKIEIQGLLNKFKKTSIEKEDQKNVIRLLGGSNKHIPSLSKFVILKYSESMGRCLSVTTDVKPGDVLAIEKPYAGIPRLAGLEHYCRNCFKLCLSGIPCLTCSLVIYCDETCRFKSYESGHKYECPMLSTFYCWPSMDNMEHLSLYIVLTTICNFGLEKYVATIRALNIDNTDPIMRGFSADGKLLSDQFCSVYSLEGNEAKRTVSDLFMRHCFAAVMVSFLTLMGLKIPDDQLGVVGGSVVHIICVVASNAHGITQTPKRKTWSISSENIEFMPVASLLMPVLSLLNHSCDPNVVRHNYNGTVVLRAIQPIPKNSQLFDNYGKVYATHTKELRQQMLTGQYCFQCNCKPCEENWPLYTVLEVESPSKYIILTEIEKTQLIQFKKDIRKLDDIITEMKEKNSDGLEYIQFLYYHLTFLHNNVKRPVAEYNECQETIKEVFYRSIDKFTIEDG